MALIPVGGGCHGVLCVKHAEKPPVSVVDYCFIGERSEDREWSW